jgi:hypothetical protein
MRVQSAAFRMSGCDVCLRHAVEELWTKLQEVKLFVKHFFTTIVDRRI